MKRLISIIILSLLTHESVATTGFAEARELAEQGDAWYQAEIALMYHKGKGVPQNYAKAVVWYRKAAEQGLSRAQTNLGVMYSEGQGVPEDHAVAVDWFRKAAEQGSAEAQHNLGLMYGRGQGVSQDWAEAYVWESLAATSGHKNAIVNRDLCASKLSSDKLKSAQRRETFLFLQIQSRQNRILNSDF